MRHKCGQMNKRKTKKRKEKERKEKYTLMKILEENYKNSLYFASPPTGEELDPQPIVSIIL